MSRDFCKLESFTEKRFWPKGLAPFPLQLEAVYFSLSRTGQASYVALAPGLGKTIVAALLANRLNLKNPTRIYYVCPPFLGPNTESEFQKWGAYQHLQLIPDTRLSRPEVKAQILLDLKAWRKGAPGRKAVLVVDEAHRFANEKSQRSAALFELARYFKRIVFMSGTPSPNSRPLELWPILKRFAPDVFGTDFWKFGKRYCGAKQVEFWTVHGPQKRWDFNGFSNRKEFKQKLYASFMYRVQKKDVELGLPPKVEGLITVGPGMPPVISRLERKVLEHFSPEDLIKGRLTKRAGKEDLHLAEYLRLLGEHKLKYTLPYIQAILTETRDNVLIFAHHKSVIAELTSLLQNFHPLVIDGSTPTKRRQAIVDEFQRDPRRRVFIGNTQAAGIGLTMTKASRVLILEPSWRDGDNEQAADRAHRIGQKSTVLVQYVVLKDSFERKRMEVLLNKRRDAV